jgi:hypothetical protein
MSGIDPVTTGLTALDDFFLFGIKLSPAINAWILSNIEKHKQRVMQRRIKLAKHHAIKATYTADQIPPLVRLDFADLTDTQREDIISLLDYELFKK